jgi:hypothetical protein
MKTSGCEAESDRIDSSPIFPGRAVLKECLSMVVFVQFPVFLSDFSLQTGRTQFVAVDCRSR